MTERSRLHPPFLWPAEKPRVADFVLRSVPPYFGGYLEPLLGGGAATLALLSRYPETTFTLSSADAEIANVWQVIQWSVDGLIAEVRRHREANSERYFAEVRGWDARGDLLDQSDVARAGRFVYLCGATLGGGYPRDDDGFASGRFGGGAVAFDEGNLRAVSRLLQERDVRLFERSLFESLPDAREDDFVYLSAPVASVASPATAPAAAPAVARELRSVVNTLTAKGVFVMASDGLPSVFDEWRSLVRVPAEPDGEPLWANQNLARALKRS